MSTYSTFTVTGGSSDFLDRQKNLFDRLNEAEREAKSSNSEVFVEEEVNSQSTQEIGIIACDTPRNFRQHQRSRTKHFRGKESIYKYHEVRPVPLKSIPDHKKNPHKWIKYSLGDVSAADMSDKTNTNTALAFLSELRQRNANNDSNDGDDQTSKRTVVFKKPSSLSIRRFEVAASSNTKADSQWANKSAFRGTKRIMPEYVVGQHATKKNAKRSVDSGCLTGPTLKLNHLSEQDEVD